VGQTLGILKSLYPRADLDAVGEGFAVTCSDEEPLKLIEDFAVMVGHIVDMLPVGHDVIILTILSFSFMWIHYHEWKLSLIN
jgi:hypothetical protein